MRDLNDVFFGYADAGTEAEREPSTFQKVFYDPHNHLQEIIDGKRFIILGRKGDGKTAYGAKIGLMKESSKIKSYQRSLNNFNNVIFEKIKTYDKLGGNPYISFWKCIIMIECVKMIEHYSSNIQLEEYTSILEALHRNGLLENENDISVTISKLVETNTTFNLRNFVGHGRKKNYEEILQGAEQIYTAIYNAIKNIYIKDHFILIVDGLDDILRYSEFKPEIITGLIRACDEINRKIAKETLSLKNVILIRDDILNVCRDPNLLSKIIRDSGIRLSWRISDNPYDSELIQLVNRRFSTAWKAEEPFSVIWKELFPDKIAEKDSLEYVLDNIIYRPRDILQFFIEAQKEYTPGKKFSQEKLQTILYNYSNEYFVEAMRDELTGFFPNEVVTALPDVLSRLGTKYFHMKDFEIECKKYKAFSDVIIRDILEKLFDAGYIGQHRPKDINDYTVFSYRNEKERFVEEHECIVHRGLMRALTIT